jgi:hypothetical protein
MTGSRQSLQRKDLHGNGARIRAAIFSTRQRGISLPTRLSLLYRADIGALFTTQTRRVEEGTQRNRRAAALMTAALANISGRHCGTLSYPAKAKEKGRQRPAFLVRE